MPRNITVTFSDGTSHVYQNAPDDLTPDMVTARAQKDFGKSVTALDGGRGKAPAAPSEVPGARQEPGTWQKVRNVIAPTVEMLGGAAGGVIGAPLGPAGVVGGAGLGYGIAKQALRLGDVYLGGEKQAAPAEAFTQAAKDVLEGATFEAGGRAIPQVLMQAGRAIKNMPYNRATKVAKAAVMEDMPEVINALRSAPPGATVAEATSKIKNPAWQALVQESLERDPAGARYLARINAMSDAEATNALTKLAGGQTAAQVRGTSEAAKKAVSSVTTPMREAALGRADLGQKALAFEKEAEALSATAAQQVEDVRRFTRLGETAEAASAKVPVRAPSGERIGQPLAPGRYTYMGDLAKVADKFATDAAQGSLKAGEAARQFKGASDALRAAGIQPLKTDEVVAKLQAVLKDPDYAANDLIKGSVNNIIKDLKEWTTVDGVIPARGLDAIRKNSVNAAIADLRKGFDASAIDKAASGVLSRVKPIFDEAIESAGGTGYKEYLKQHAAMSQKVAEKQLAGEALELYRTNKQGFIDLVQNNSPDVVEKILGPGKYNIAKELADDAYGKLQQIAEKNIAKIEASNQATEGQKALTTLLRQNALKFRLPSWMSAAGAAFNKGLSELERAIGTNSMRQLSIAMQDPRKAEDLLKAIPPAERTRILDIIADPTRLKGAGELFQVPELQRARQATQVLRSSAANRLIPSSESENQNALAR